MNATELLAVEASVTEVEPGAIPPDLADRARAYGAAVDAFHGAVRSALASLDRGLPVQGEAAAALRTSAKELVAARDWLLDRPARSGDSLTAPDAAPGPLAGRGNRAALPGFGHADGGAQLRRRPSRSTG